MKRKIQFRINIKSKHLLVIMTLFCLVCIIGTFAAGIGTDRLQNTAGMIVVPFQNSIESISGQLDRSVEVFKDKRELIKENEDLKLQIESLISENNKLIQDQSELEDLQELYSLDREYGDFPKVAARIISKNPGNWYDTFMINKGSNDGIRVDNNVIAGKGLVGIVINVGPNWATVRSIIDDSSHVSAMTGRRKDRHLQYQREICGRPLRRLCKPGRAGYQQSDKDRHHRDACGLPSSPECFCHYRKQTGYNG